MYTLYTIPGTCSTGIAVLMEKLNLQFTSVTREEVPNYIEIVPTNQVPALKTESGKIVTEGPAIALYLLEKHGSDMIPSDIEERAEFYQWLNFDYSTLHPAYGSIFAIASNDDIANELKLEVMQYLADKVSDIWAVLNEHLTNQKYTLGEKPCHVDYMATVYSSWNNYFPNTKITLGENVKRFVKDVSLLSEFKAGYVADGATFKIAE